MRETKEKNTKTFLVAIRLKSYSFAHTNNRR